MVNMERPEKFIVSNIANLRYEISNINIEFMF